MAAIKWNGSAGDNNWNNPANWTPAQVPGASDTVTISESAATLINISQADAAQALSTSTKITLSINDNASLTVGNAATKNAALANAGVIALNGNSYTTALIVGGAEVTLSGGGTIAMGNSGNNRITGLAGADELNNTGNTILGGGSLGAGTLTFVNGAAGVVNADLGTQLVINTGSVAVSNAGLLEATGNGGGLVIQSAVNGGTTGHIAAMGGTVYLESGAAIAGGTLSSTGSFAVVIANSATLDGTTNAVTNTGTVAIVDGSTLTVLGGIVNQGQIALENSSYYTDLVIGPGGATAGTVTLTGNGTIALGTGGGNRIYGAIAGDTLVNLNNTIAGAGQIGVGTLTLVNDGTIDATDGNALTVNTGAAVTINNGLMEATGAGGLVLQTAVNGAGGGTIFANGGNVYLNGGNLQGGTVMTAGGAALVVSYANTGTLDGTAQTVTNDGQITVNDNGTLSLLGTFTNAGTVSLNADSYTTQMVVSGSSVTLTGGGVVQLDDSGNNQITGAAAGDALVNLNNTIEGAGRFGLGTLSITNDGTIDATGQTSLVVNTVSLTNNALMEATNTGGLILQTLVNESGGGTIFANGGNVYLNGGTLQGGAIKTAAGGALTISYGNIGTLDGTAPTVTNNGQININDNGTLSLLGTITNAGVIATGANSYDTDFIVSSPTVTLAGGGTLALDNSNNNRVYGAAGTDVLVNVNNLIEGAGQFGIGQLTFTNASAGIVDANSSAQLVLNTGSTVSNAGLLEATAGSGGLVIQSNVNNGTAGRISAAGGNVFLASGADIIGGTLSSSGTGTILDSNSATLGAVGGKLTNTGTVVMQDGTTLTLLGTIFSKGLIGLDGNSYNTDLITGTGTTVTTVTLTGSGAISLDDSGNNRLYAATAGDTLINLNNTITGAGQIGVGTGLVLVNDATINAVGGNRLTIDTGATVTNNALLESSGAGGLYLQGTINDSGGGTVLANTGNVVLNGATLQGGVVNSLAGEAVIDINSAVLDGSAQTVTNKGVIDLNDGSTLTLLGTITNTGTIALGGNSYDTDLIAGGPTVTLTGGGTILLDNSGNNQIYGTVAGDLLVNVNNVIEGAGQLGASQLTLVNEAAGVIGANDTAGLVLTGGGTAVVNAGLIESTGSGGLTIETAVNGSTGGTILANGGNVYLNGATIQGGLLTTGANGGLFDVNGDSTLGGSAAAVTNAHGNVIAINDNVTLTLLGSIVNHGTIDVNANSYDTDLIAGAGTTTLSGGGTIQLSATNLARLYGAAGSDVLVNVDNVIEGGGQVGAGQLTLINEAAGIIDATSTMYLNGGSVAVVNDGLIEATSGGLYIQSAVDSHGGGTILADGGNVYLNGGTLQGGVFQSEAGGALVVDGGGTLDGSAHLLTIDGAVSVGDNQTLTVLGAIDNQGTITAASSSYFSDIIIGSGTLTLTGNGTVTLAAGGPGSRFYGASAADVLDNLSNTINGGGQLGAGQLTLINSGVIDGSGLVINLGSTGLNTATGQWIGTGAGLTLTNGTYTNLGTIQADNGSSVTFQSSAVLTNDNAGGTLTGGTYAAMDTGNDATLTVTGAAVTTLAATLELSGEGAFISFGGVSIDSSLDAISAGGTLDLLADRNFDPTANGGAFTDNGAIVLGGGTFTATTLTIGKTGSFTGFGELDGNVVNNGLITIEDGQLVFGGSVTGTGSITTGTGGIVVLDGGGSLNQAVSGTGTLLLENGSYTLTKSTVSIANVDVMTDASISGSGKITGAVTDDGSVMAMGGKLILSGMLSGDGTLAAAQGATLAVSGGGTFSGMIEGPGRVHIGKKITLDAGTTLAVHMLQDTADIVLGSGTTLTNMKGNTFSIGTTPPATDGGPPHRAQIINITGMGSGSFANTGLLKSLSDAQFQVAFSNTSTVSVVGGTLGMEQAVTGAGLYTVAAGALLDLAGGGDFAAKLQGAGTIEFDQSFTLDQGATLGASSVIDTATLTLGTGENVTTLAGTNFTLADSMEGSDRHRAQVAVTGGSGSVFTNAGTVTSTADAGAFNLGFVNSGAVSASAGTLSFLGAATNNGMVVANAAEVDFSASVAGTGTLAIGAGGTIGLLAGSGVGQVADFQASTGLLALTTPLNFGGTIMGFGVGDQIDLVATKETSYSVSNDILTVKNGNRTVATLHFAGSYATGDFSFASDAHGGTLITHT